MGKIKIYMVRSNCHAERFKKIDWLKKKKNHETKYTRYNDPLNFMELDNTKFIQLLRDLVNGRCVLYRRLDLFYISYDIFNKFNVGE